MIKAVVFDYGAVLNRRLRLQKPLLELAAKLRGQGIKTAVLSNASSWRRPLAWAVMVRGDLKDFDPVIFSFQIGVSKPDPKSYQAIIKRLGVDAGECLLVDNRADNIAGAKAAGMQTIQDKNTAQTIADIKVALAE